MSDDPLIQTLPSCELLDRFQREHREILASYGVFTFFREREVIIREGQDQDCLYFVVHGSLNAIHRDGDRATPIGQISQGEWFGEINILDPQSATAEVVAREDCRIWRISRTRLEEFLNAYPPLGCLLLLGIGEVLAHRMRKTLGQLNAIRHAGY